MLDTFYTFEKYCKVSFTQYEQLICYDFKCCKDDHTDRQFVTGTCTHYNEQAMQILEVTLL